MSDETPLRRGEPETRTHFERFRDAFEAAEGDTFITERIVECPTCGMPMTKRSRVKRDAGLIMIDLECDADEAHNDQRAGVWVP